MEAVLVAAVAGLAAWQSAEWGLGLAAAVTSLLVVIMVPASRYYLRRSLADPDLASVHRLEMRFQLHIWFVSLCIGLMAAYSLLFIDDQQVHLLLLLLTLGAMITNIRDHSRPLLPLGKTIALVAPVTVGGLLSGDLTYQALGLCAVLTGKLITDIAKELYGHTLAFQLALKEQARMARELAVQNLDLEARESQRLAQEAELKRLQIDLVQVSSLSAMGTMASTMAHELNQPLTAVANFARGSRRLLEEPTPARIEKAAQGMAQVEAGAIRAGQIVRRIRGLVHRGDAQTKPEPLRAIVDEACELAFVDARLLGVDREVRLSRDDLWVNVDAIQIQQVLINLIRNAVESVHKLPGAKVSVVAVEAGPLVTVAVSDNGPGISDTVREDLFSPFNSTKSQGLGLGLSISRTIIEAHGGKIWSENQPGGGATFRFTLQRTDPAEQKQERRMIGRRG